MNLLIVGGNGSGGITEEIEIRNVQAARRLICILEEWIEKEVDE